MILRTPDMKFLWIHPKWPRQPQYRDIQSLSVTQEMHSTLQWQEKCWNQANQLFCNFCFKLKVLRCPLKTYISVLKILWYIINFILLWSFLCFNKIKPLYFEGSTPQERHLWYSLINSFSYLPFCRLSACMD